MKPQLVTLKMSMNWAGQSIVYSLVSWIYFIVKVHSKFKCRLMRMKYTGDRRRVMKSWNGHIVPLM